MSDTIITYIFAGICFLISLFVYVFLISSLFPKLFIVPTYNCKKIRDRGLKKYLFDGGRAILYEPAPNVKKGVEQYILSDNGGEKYIKCKVCEGVKSIKYRILTFDAYDKPLGAFDVSEPINESGITNAVNLPLYTAYVSIELLKVNEVNQSNSSAVHFSPPRIAVYFALSTLSTFVMTLAVHRVFAVIIEKFLVENFNTGYFIISIIGIILGILSSFWILKRSYAKDLNITFPTFPKDYLKFFTNKT
jgi:hypothetical protein